MSQDTAPDLPALARECCAGARKRLLPFAAPEYVPHGPDSLCVCEIVAPYLRRAVEPVEAERAKLGQALADAANEIPCAGPVAHRIRVLREEWSRAFDRLREQRDAAEKALRDVLAALDDKDLNGVVNTAQVRAGVPMLSEYGKRHYTNLEAARAVLAAADAREREQEGKR